jgi:hypothetical protein
MVRPEWKKIPNVFNDIKNTYKNSVVVDIDKDYFHKVNIKKELSGFPTILYISKKGKEIEDIDTSIQNDRSIDSFVEWIKLKNKTSTKSSIEKGGTKNKSIKKGGTKNKSIKKTKKGRKWSNKYKKSINCRTPHGFSQKQYCKYRKN